MLRKLVGHIDIELLPVWHHHTEYIFFAQSLYAQRCDHRTVLAAGKPDYRFAALTILLEPVTDPLYDLISYFFCIKTHFITSRFSMLLYLFFRFSCMTMQNLYLTQIHSLQSRCVCFRHHARAALSVHHDLKLREPVLHQHRV